MKKVIFYIFFIQISLCSCTSQINREKTTEFIDLNNVAKPSFYDYFSSMELIPLETNDSSLINYVNKIVHRNDCYYILDKVADRILVFDDCGKFLKDINKKGNGPGEYTGLSDFCFNDFTNELNLLVPMGGIYRYDTLGNEFKGKIPFPDNVPAVHNFIPLEKGIYILFSESKEGKKILIYDIDQFKVLLEMYDVPKYIFFKTPYHHTYSPFYVLNNQIHFVQSYNGDVFTIDKNGMSLKYHWDFGEQNFSIDKLPERNINYYRKYMMTVGAKYANAFTEYGENSSYYITKFLYKQKAWTIIYDKHQGKTVIFNQFQEGNFCFPIFLDEEALYTYVNPAWPIAQKYIGDVDANISKQMEQISPESNPVIIKNVFK